MVPAREVESCQTAGPARREAVPPGSVALFVLGILVIGAIASDVVAANRTRSPEGTAQDPLVWKFQYDDSGRPVSIVNPAGAAVSFRYEKAGDDDRGQRIVREYADGTKVSYEFDRWGRQTRMTDSAGTVSYTYDDLGRPTRVQRRGSPAIAYTYDTLDRLTRLQVGDFYTVEYTYDFLGRLESMKTPAGIVEYEYLTGQGQVVRMLPNGVRTFWSYGSNGQLQQIVHGLSRNPEDTRYVVLAEYAYQYQSDGRIEAIRERSSGGDFVTSYKYDDVGRLRSVRGPGSQEYRYQYDLLGNRTGALGPGHAARRCTYDWAGRMVAVDGGPCQYDAAGNLTHVNTGDTATAYHYDQKDQLTEVGGKVSYRYDGNGRLVARKTAGSDTTFISNPLSLSWQPFVMETAGDQTLVIWEGTTPLLMIRKGIPEYLLHDHLGSVRLTTDAQGRVIRRHDYEPFGLLTSHAEAEEFSPRFAGVFWDPAGGVYLTRTRAYCPRLARFLQMDPEYRIPLGSQEDLSAYAYCGADPVNYVDRNGLEAESADIVEQSKGMVTDTVLESLEDLPGDWGTTFEAFNVARARWDFWMDAYETAKSIVEYPGEPANDWRGLNVALNAYSIWGAGVLLPEVAGGIGTLGGIGYTLGQMTRQRVLQNRAERLLYFGGAVLNRPPRIRWDNYDRYHGHFSISSDRYAARGGYALRYAGWLSRRSQSDLWALSRVQNLTTMDGSRISGVFRREETRTEQGANLFNFYDPTSVTIERRRSERYTVTRDGTIEQDLRILDVPRDSTMTVSRSGAADWFHAQDTPTSFVDAIRDSIANTPQNGHVPILITGVANSWEQAQDAAEQHLGSGAIGIRSATGFIVWDSLVAARDQVFGAKEHNIVWHLQYIQQLAHEMGRDDVSFDVKAHSNGAINLRNESDLLAAAVAGGLRVRSIATYAVSSMEKLYAVCRQLSISYESYTRFDDPVVHLTLYPRSVSNYLQAKTGLPRVLTDPVAFYMVYYDKISSIFTLPFQIGHHSIGTPQGYSIPGPDAGGGSPRPEKQSPSPRLDTSSDKARIYGTQEGLPDTIHQSMVSMGVRGTQFDGIDKPRVLAYGSTQKAAEEMAAAVRAMDPTLEVVIRWGSAADGSLDNLRDLKAETKSDIVFVMRSRSKGMRIEEPKKREPEDRRKWKPDYPPFWWPGRPEPIPVPIDDGGDDGGGGGGNEPPPPDRGGAGLLTSSRVGGVYLTGSARSLVGVGLLDGVTLDRNGNLVLLGKSGDPIKLPPLRLDDVVTVFRSVYLNGEGPMVTIDPDARDPERLPMIVRHSEATDNTYVGWVLYQADRLMKGYTLGVDNISRQKVESRVAEYPTVLDTMYFGGEDRGKLQREGHWERFWIVPAQVRRLGAARNELTLFDVPLKVNTQTMKWQSGALVDDPAGKSSPGALAFTAWFTANFDLIAGERFLTPPPESGIREPVPVFAELWRIALITAIAEKLRDQGVPMPFWMREYEVRPVPFEKTTPGLEVTRSNQTVVARIFGGVNLSVEDKNVKQIARSSDLSPLPAAERDRISRKMEVVDFLEKGIRESPPSIEPLKPWTLSDPAGGTYQAVAVPGTETQALAPCRLEETDLVVPTAGGRTIELTRSYNSFFQPSGPWGKGWALNLPHLDEIKVPVRRDANQAQYQVAYEVVTPLNSVYVRLARIEKVSELNGSRLQTPDKPCEFFGLADAKPEFLSGPTHELIRKDGGIWHFSQAGDLVAIEDGGFRTIYERDGKGRVARIVGLLGRRSVASIELRYNPVGRLDSAVAKGSKYESTVRYEYDDTGRLSAAVSDVGRQGYRYDGPWVKAVTFRARAEDAAQMEELVVRRFEYDARGQLLAEVDATGARMEYRVTRDSQGSEMRVEHPGSGSGADSVRYDSAMRPVQAKYANGAQAVWSYPDSGGAVLELQDSAGAKTRFTESADHSRRALRMGDGTVIAGEYDSTGRLTSLSEGGHTLLRQEWSGDGRLSMAANETCAVHMEYGPDGLVSRTLLTPAGERGQLKQWQQTSFDGEGRAREIKDYRGLEILVDYDGTGQPSEIVCKRDGKNYGFHIARDSVGRVQEVESSWGNERYTYEKDGALNTCEMENSGRKASVQWESGLVRRVVQFDGGETQVRYGQGPSDKNLPREVLTPNGLQLNYDYDQHGQLKSVNVQGAYRMNFAYDVQGRLTSLTQSPWDK